MTPSDGLRRGASGSAARVLCVFVHGRGQSPEEMEAHVLARLNARGVAFALPRAPRGAWYDAKAVDPLTGATRAQLAEALALIEGEVSDLRHDYPGRPLLLGGFSQGACLAIEYASAGQQAPDALVALTGCRVGTVACERPHAAKPNLPAYLTGSDADPWIPITAMAEALADLGRQRLHLRADILPGRGHEVSDTEIAMLDGMLADLAAERPPGFASSR